MRYQVRAIILASVVSVFTLWGTPARTQENTAETTTEETVISAPTGDPRFAVTTKNPQVPIEELELLVRPLTLAELENESAAWLILLKTKVQEISDAEIAIKRQNQSIDKQQEASNELQKSREALNKAEEQLRTATQGSPEYEEATKKVEEAKENLRKAQTAIQEAKDAQRDTQADSNLKGAIDKAQETEALEKAKTALDEARKQRENLTAGTPAYETATQRIDKLDTAIIAFEDAQTKQKEAVPDSPEFAEATKNLEAAKQSLIQAREEIEGKKDEDTTQKSAQELNKAESAVGTTKIEGDGDTTTENLTTQGEKLEQASEQLDQNAEQETELKNQLVATVTELQSERTALVDRFKVVLDELERKGGSADSYRKYIEAISRVTIDLQDTEGAGVRIVSWLQSEEGGIRWAINIGKFVGIVAISVVASQSLGNFINKSLQQFAGGSELLRQFIVMVVKRGGIVVGVMLALTALEVSLGPILALVGGASFVLAFALQSNLGNFASGLMIMLNKPFDIGDEVKVGGIWGYVDSISLASTKIKGFNGEMYIMPNNNAWGGLIENFSHGENRRIVMALRLGFGEDVEKIRNLLLEILKSHPQILDNPAPFTYLWQYQEYYISLYVAGWTTQADYWAVNDNLVQTIQQRFQKENISVAAIPESKVHYLNEGMNHKNGNVVETIESFPDQVNLTYES
jgi:small conductance mechanosensitive channel